MMESDGRCMRQMGRGERRKETGRLSPREQREEGGQERIQRDVRGAIWKEWPASGGRAMDRSGEGAVASSGRGAVATLTASNVVARVELFSQAPYYGSS